MSARAIGMCGQFGRWRKAAASHEADSKVRLRELVCRSGSPSDLVVALRARAVQCVRRPAKTGRRRSHEPRVTRRAPALCRQASLQGGTARLDRLIRLVPRGCPSCVRESGARGKPLAVPDPNSFVPLYAHDRKTRSAPQFKSQALGALRDGVAARTRRGRRRPFRRPDRQLRTSGYAASRGRSATAAGPGC